MTIAEAFELRGEERGEKRGQLKKTTKIAINMLNKKMDIEQIAELIELDIPFIQKLNQERFNK